MSITLINNIFITQLIQTCRPKVFIYCLYLSIIFLLWCLPFPLCNIQQFDVLWITAIAFFLFYFFCLNLALYFSLLPLGTFPYGLQLFLFIFFSQCLLSATPVSSIKNKNLTYQWKPAISGLCHHLNFISKLLFLFLC